MDSKYTHWAGLLLVLVFALFSYGCSNDSSSGSGPAPAPTPTLSANTLNLSVIDAKTNAPIQAQVVVTNGASVSNAAGVDSLNTSNGLLSLIVADLPAEVSLLVKSAGYLSGATTVTVTEGADNTLSLRLVKISTDAAELPEGVSGASGTNTAAVEVNSPIGASVNLPSEQAQVDLVLFSDQSAASLDAFPGGFGVEVSGQDGAQEGAFVTAGFLAIEVTDAEGNPVEQLPEGEVAVLRIEIDPSTIDAVTGVEVNATTSTVPVFSFDEDTGEWTEEVAAADVQRDADGLFVEFSTNHFSYWNMDWFFGEVCTATIEVTATNPRPYTLRLVPTSGRGYTTSAVVNGDAVETMTFLRVPADAPFNLFVTPEGGDELQVGTDVVLCPGPTSVSVEFEFQQLASIDAVVSGVCPEDSSNPDEFQRLQFVPVWLQRPNGSFRPVGYTDAAGGVTFNAVPDGNGYQLYALDYIDTQNWVIQSLDVVSGVASPNPVPFDFTLPANTEICTEVVTGGSGSAN